MITVPEASKTIIERSRYLSEALSKDLINLSSLARYIKPEIEDMLMKKVSTGALIMALKRIQKDQKPKVSHVKFFKIPPQLKAVTELTLYRFSDKKLSDIKNYEKSEAFLSSTKEESIIVTSSHNSNLKGFTSKVDNVGAIIINLPDGSETTSGIHYFFLKSIAWEGINILETFSNSKQYILIFSNSDLHRAFRIITSLFSR